MDAKPVAAPESKFEEVYKKLRDLAFTRGPGAQLPTIRVLCDELKTTRVTLSKALAQLETEQILYRKERLGIYVSPTLNHRSIAILFDSTLFDEVTLSPFWSLLLIHARQEAKRRSLLRDEIHTLHFIRPSNHANLAQNQTVATLLGTEGVDGILAIGLNTDTIHKMDNSTLPCVSFNGYSPYTVQLDNDDFGYQAARALIRQGCQRIAFWANAPHHAYHTPQMRTEMDIQELATFTGFRRALEEQRVPLSPHLARIPRSSLFARTISLQEQGYLLAHEVFNRSQEHFPDGIVIANDLLTDGALVAFDELNIQIGHDVQLASHANAGSPILFGRTQHMTILEYDPVQIVEAMFSLLDALMNGRRPLSPHVVLRPRLRSPQYG